MTCACISVRMCKLAMLSKGSSFLALSLRSSSHLCVSCVGADLRNVIRGEECKEEPFPIPSSPTQCHREQEKGIHFMNGIHVMALPKAQKNRHGKVRRSQLLTCHGMCGSVYRDLPLSPLSSSKTETRPPWQLIALERGWLWVPGKCH